MVDKFLHEVPKETLDNFRAYLERKRGFEKRIDEYRIKAEDMQDGALIAFTDIIHEAGSIATGGSGYSFSFSRKGKTYIIEDMYCPAPDCKCKTIHLLFIVKSETPSGEIGYFCTNPRKVQ